MNNKTNLVHYVEEVWKELSYAKGITERKIILPIVSRESYEPLPWVKEFKFFDLEKSNENSSKQLNISPIINNKKYNPFYYIDDQLENNEEYRIKIEIANYVKEIWLEIDYSTKQITEREIILPITNRKTYKPASWVKKYNFVDFKKINIDGKVIIDKTPLNETTTYSNKIIDSFYLNYKPLTNNIELPNIKVTNNTSKRKILTPFEVTKIASTRKVISK